MAILTEDVNIILNSPLIILSGLQKLTIVSFIIFVLIIVFYYLFNQIFADTMQ